MHIGQASIKRQSNFNPGQPQTLATGLFMFNSSGSLLMSVVVIMIMMKDYVGLEESKRALLQKDSLFFVAFCPFPISLVNRRTRKGVIALHPLAFTAPPPLSLRTASLINCKTILTRNWRCNNAFSFIRLCSTRSARSML